VGFIDERQATTANGMASFSTVLFQAFCTLRVVKVLADLWYLKEY
jgi:hypothetical protein